MHGLAGDLVASVTGTIGGTTTAKWQITNLHGDVVASVTDGLDWSDAGYTIADEYGNTTSTSRYGWLGGAQRSKDTLGGLTLMGARLYNPTTGRFLTTDPVVGGNANTYGYPEDPINRVDTSGRSWQGFYCRSAQLYSWIMGLGNRIDGLYPNIYGGSSHPDNVRNAVRHYMINLLLAARVGWWLTTRVMNSHEGNEGTPDSWSDRYNNWITQRAFGFLTRYLNGGWDDDGIRDDILFLIQVFRVI